MISYDELMSMKAMHSYEAVKDGEAIHHFPQSVTDIYFILYYYACI